MKVRPPQTGSPDASRSWLLGLLLAAAVILSYQPAWNAGFIWDDDKYVTGNPLLTAPDGLQRIWFSLDSPSQYFPLTYTVLRLERSLWGLDPAGYHWINILLHGVNALLLWRLLRRLSLPGSWLAAALFALHPVQVESVAWITEHKNTLSLLFSLLAVRAWMEFIGRSDRPVWNWYLASLLCYQLALFSKTTACTLPAALLLILWWQQKRIDRHRLLQLAPFLLLGLLMGLLTIWWERHHQGVGGKLSMDLLDRFLIASRAIWFYLGKLVWPANLSFSYPRWNIDAASPLAYLGIVATVAFAAALLYLRRRLGRSPETAALFYVATLGPMLGFFALATFRYTFVADHYQYVACIGPLTLAAAGVLKAAEALQKRSGLPPFVLPAILLTALAVLTWRQARNYSDAETLWRATLRTNPDSILAHGSLANMLVARGNPAEAIEHYRRALELRPEAATAYNLGNALAAVGRTEEAIESYRWALQMEPSGPAIAFRLGQALASRGQFEEAIRSYRRALELQPGAAPIQNSLASALLDSGDIRGAVVEYEAALQGQPNSISILCNLSWLLAASPDPSVRNGIRSLELAQQANRLTAGRSPWALRSLAAALAETGRLTEAAAVAQRALEFPETGELPALRSSLQAQLNAYTSGSVFRDPALPGQFGP